jgi:hypothetical protein
MHSDIPSFCVSGITAQSSWRSDVPWLRRKIANGSGNARYRLDRRRPSAAQIGQFVGDVLEGLGEVSTGSIPEQLRGLVQHGRIFSYIEK